LSSMTVRQSTISSISEPVDIQLRSLLDEVSELRSALASVQLRELASSFIPSGSTIPVLSKGDQSLLRLGPRLALHFPSLADGTYAGHHPGDSLSAIAQLEAKRAGGAEFLVAPAGSRWWFEYYDDFARHINRYYRLLSCDESSLLVDLRSDVEVEPSDLARFNDISEAFESLTGRPPCVLDWGPPFGLGDSRPDLPVFTPATCEPRLPYLDQSVDLVAVDAHSDERLGEAHRVGTVVATRLGSDRSRDRWQVDWSRVGGKAGRRRSITQLPTFEQIAGETT